MSITLPMLSVMSLVVLMSTGSNHDEVESVFSSPDTIKNRALDSRRMDQAINQVLNQRIFSKNQVIKRNVLLRDSDKDLREDMLILPNVLVEFTRDQKLNEYPISEQSKQIEFIVDEGAFLKLDKHSTLLINNATKLTIRNKGTIEVSDSAVLHIIKGSHLQLDSGARLIVRSDAKIWCDDHAVLSVNPYSNIILQHPSSSIYIDRQSELRTTEGYRVAIRGEGEMFIDNRPYKK